MFSFPFCIRLSVITKSTNTTFITVLRLKTKMYIVENEKKILLLDFYVVTMMETKSGFICKSDKFDLFILPISSNCANLSVNYYYRIVRPNIANFIN